MSWGKWRRSKPTGDGNNIGIITLKDDLTTCQVLVIPNKPFDDFFRLGATFSNLTTKSCEITQVIHTEQIFTYNNTMFCTEVQFSFILSSGYYGDSSI